MKHVLVAAAILVLSAGSARTAVHIVKPDGSGEYPTIQAAVDGIALGDTVGLATGVFTGAGNVNVNFHARPITVRSLAGEQDSCIIDCGGADNGFVFDSGELPMSVLEGVTILNGLADLGGAIYCSNYSAPVIRGCRISSCSAGDWWGGAVYCVQAFPTFVGCEFSNNSAEKGGALYCNESSVRLQGCTLRGNSASRLGGGICAENRCTITIENSIIAFTGAGEGVYYDATSDVDVACSDLYGNLGGDWAGGIAGLLGTAGNISADPLFCGSGDLGRDSGLWSNSPCAAGANPECGLIGAHPVVCSGILVLPDGSGPYATIQAAVDAAAEGDTVYLAAGVFQGPGNRDVDYGGKAIELRSQMLDPTGCVIDCGGEGRGVIFHSGEDAGSVLRAVRIEHGLADQGGGIFISGASPTLIGCIVTDCWADAGGGIGCLQGAPRIATCTVAGNAAPVGGGVYAGVGAGITLENTIVAFARQGAGLSCATGGAAALACCDVFGNAGGDWTGCIADQHAANGNLAADPLFCGSGDYSLRPDSPCAPFTPPNPECDGIGACPTRCGGSFLVRADGTGDFPTIQAAIDAASDGDEIQLANGVFEGDGNRDIRFHGKAVRLRSASGNPGECIIDCGGSSQTPHIGFLCQSGDGPGTMLEGVGIRHAYGSGGGAVAGFYAQPTLIQCVFSDCSSDIGGGGFWYHSSPAYVRCTFADNIAWGSPGGGALCSDISNVTVQQCTFVGNQAVAGAGVMAWFHSTVDMQGSIVAFSEQGDAVHCEDGTVSLACCDLFGNVGGDWVDCVASQYGASGNICADPLFCGASSPNVPYGLWSNSPCAPGATPDCGQIGAWPVGCGAQGVRDPDLATGRDSEFALRWSRIGPQGGRLVYSLPAGSAGSRVSLTIYDIAGRLIRTLEDGPSVPGMHGADWNARDAQERLVPSGLYFARLATVRTADRVRSCRILIVKQE
jgi:predicted outer membrane repeat protein